MSKGVLVFVYGTLRKGFGNHYHLGPAAYEKNYEGAFWQPGFRMVSLGAFPGAIETGDDKDDIWVEAYRVDLPRVVHTLDILEGHPRFYERKKIVTPLGEGWIYTLPVSKYGDADPVPSGKWGDNSVEKVISE